MPVCRDLIDIMVPGLLEKDESATLTYYGELRLVIESEKVSNCESIYDYSNDLRLAVAASIPKLLALAMKDAHQHSDDSNESKEDHANNPRNAVA